MEPFQIPTLSPNPTLERTLCPDYHRASPPYQNRVQVNDDAINNGQLEKGESKPLTKKTYGGGATTTKAPNPIDVSAIIPQQTLASPKKAC